MQKETEEIIKLRNEIRQDMKDYKLSMTVINHEKVVFFMVKE
jgi:hypothetical protein